MAAGTIDAGVKIYAVRVDAVHADTYKVLGGLGKESAPTKDVGSPEEGVPFTPFLLSSSWFHPQYFLCSSVTPLNFKALFLSTDVYIWENTTSLMYLFLLKGCKILSFFAWGSLRWEPDAQPCIWVLGQLDLNAKQAWPNLKHLRMKYPRLTVLCFETEVCC